MDLMQYHKIPQNVTSYEGRIVGKFTARQFTYLAIGGIIIFLLASVPIGSTYKFTIGTVVSLVSLLFALVTFEGRGTDMWLLLFVRAVLLPTQRLWRKDEVPPSYLLPSYVVPHQVLGPKRRTTDELTVFLEKWRPEEKTAGLTEEEQKFLQKLKSI